MEKSIDEFEFIFTEWFCNVFVVVFNLRVFVPHIFQDDYSFDEFRWIYKTLHKIALNKLNTKLIIENLETIDFKLLWSRKSAFASWVDCIFLYRLYIIVFKYPRIELEKRCLISSFFFSLTYRLNKSIFHFNQINILYKISHYGSL